MNFTYNNPNWSKNDPKEIVIQEIPRHSKVLDVGCGIGVLGGWLTKNKACVVDGAEYHPDAIIQAKKRLRNVFEINLNNIPTLKVIKDKYDVITLVDVLEHCLQPEDILLELAKKLKKGGYFVISLPNVAHYSVRFGLMAGTFEYADSGILDKTHVKFYTKQSMVGMIKKAKLEPELVGYTLPLSGKWKFIGRLHPEIAATQFVFKAR